MSKLTKNLTTFIKFNIKPESLKNSFICLSKPLKENFVCKNKLTGLSFFSQSLKDKALNKKKTYSLISRKKVYKDDKYKLSDKDFQYQFIKEFNNKFFSRVIYYFILYYIGPPLAFFSFIFFSELYLELKKMVLEMFI